MFERGFLLFFVFFFGGRVVGGFVAVAEVGAEEGGALGLRPAFGAGPSVPSVSAASIVSTAEITVVAAFPAVVVPAAEVAPIVSPVTVKSSVVSAAVVPSVASEGPGPRRGADCWARSR